MLIANSKSCSETITLSYWRQFLGQAPQLDTIKVSVNSGPNLIERALNALAVQCSVWNARDSRWKYWLG